MTTKEIEERMENISNQISEIRRKRIEPLEDELFTLEEKRIKNIIANKEYVTDLSEYEGKRLANFTALGSQGEDVYIPRDELVYVENGKLEASSFRGGLVFWHENKQRYVHTYSGRSEDLDIVGFIDIEVDRD